MKKHIHYTDEPLELGEAVVDFLPPPSKLVARPETVKITLDLNKESVDFFKQEAKKKKIPYQRMLRALVDEYTKHHQQQSS